jgi:hypothetical protein
LKTDKAGCSWLLIPSNLAKKVKEWERAHIIPATNKTPFSRGLIFLSPLAFTDLSHPQFKLT